MISYTVSDFYTAESDFPLTDKRCERSLDEFGAWTWNGKFDEYSSFSDVYKNGRGKVFVESITINDNIGKKFRKRNFDSAYISEKINNAISSLISDNFIIKDSKKSKFSFPIKDGFYVKDLSSRSFNKHSFENTYISDNIYQKLSFAIHDNIQINDSPHLKYMYFVKDKFFVEDTSRSAISKSLFESVSFFDYLSKSASIKLKDPINYSDFIHLTDKFVVKDNICAYERSFRKNAVNNYESITSYDFLDNITNWKRFYSESSNVSDFPIKHMENKFFEYVIGNDKDNKEFYKNTSYSILANDISRIGFKFDRDFMEGISVYDSEYSSYISSYEETCKFLDEIVHNSNGILYDISLSEGPLSVEEFREAINTPAGYSPFVDFRVGDYEYKNAIYRFIMQKKDLDVNPLLSDLCVHVDIPDTNDRGTANIPSEVTRVYFNKSYYNPPEVVVTVIGGSESSGIVIPYLISTDKYDDSGRYFEVKLVNDSGTIVSGIISWTAKGY